MADLAKKLEIETGNKVEMVAADLTDSNDLASLERILREDSRVTLLVNNAGVAAATPLVNSDLAAKLLNGVYGGSKAFVLGFSQSLRHGLAGTGVKVQVVLPGAKRRICGN